MFALTKWYLDAVDERGQTAIAYWTELAWGGLAVTWHSVALHAEGTGALTRSGVAAVAEPAVPSGSVLHAKPEAPRLILMTT